jgi:hypothetical protein
MRKIFIAASVLITVFFASCKDELDPFGETNEKYVLNCIIRSDTSYQTLTLAHSYTSTDFNPYSNTIDPAIKGAIIRLWEGTDKVTFFSDTTITRDASSPYLTPYSIYQARGIQPDAGTVLELEAILPSGKKLTATGIVPIKPAFEKLGQLDGIGDTIVPPVEKDYVRAQWGRVAAPKGTVYLPRMYIVYKVPVNGVEVRKIKLIPKNYYIYKGIEYAEYPGLSNYPWLNIDMTVINRCMAEISAGDSDKEKYKIYAIVVDVLSLDNNLSTYYNATNKNKDPYAIKLYETDFSNITGGFGVFGVSYLAGTTIDISAPYVRTFGYEHGYAKD